MKTKSLRRLISTILMMCCMTASAVGIQPSSGEGTSANPYQIATLENLYWFADHVNQGNVTANAILTADITVNTGVLDSNGDLNSGTFENWTPIGGKNNMDYSGEFNGNGHTISGLYFNNENTNSVGFFGKTATGAYIHDLGINDSYFCGDNHVGGICGDFAYGRIENCWNGATIVGTNYNAGGISGSCWRYASIANCYNVGNVSMSKADDRFGGICGSVFNSTTADYTIDNCYTLDSKCSKIRGLLAENCPETKIHSSSVRELKDFKCGEVCWLLNNELTDGSQKWFQTLGEDKDVYPTLNNASGTVFILGRNCDGSSKGYSNTPPSGEITQDAHTLDHHPYKAPTETENGNIEHWHCSVCGQNFEDSDCTKQITGSVIILNIKGNWTIIEQPTCSQYGTMQNPANPSKLRLVPKLAHHFVNGVCTVCGHAAPTKYNGTPAESLVAITEENYTTYGLTETNKDCVMGWTVISTAEEFRKYINSLDHWGEIKFNAFLAEDIIMDSNELLPDMKIGPGGFIFDGTGHTISNIYKNGSSDVGLFEYNYEESIIRNLGLISPKIVVEKWYGGCICGKNRGIIENCFVIDGYIEGTDSDLYGISDQYSSTGGKVINCYAITNKGNVGDGSVTNSYAATTGNVTDDFYANTLRELNEQKDNGITWYPGTYQSSYPVMMMSSMIHHQATVTCTEDGMKEYWYCTVCNKYYLDASHTQETTFEDLSSPALGHDMKHFDRVEAICSSAGNIEHYHCDRCGKNFEDMEGTKEIDDIVIPVNPDNHSLSIVNDKLHCEWCNKDFTNFVAIDNKPVLLNGENDNYYLDKVELKYGHSYCAGENFTTVDFSYTFPYYPNVWNSWFVPFEITTDELGEYGLGFIAAYIAGVRQYEKDAEGNVITQVDVIKIKNGKLRAGTPYLIKLESNATEPLTFTFNKTGATLKKSSDVHPLNSATTTANYDFIGTYNTIAKENIKSNYYILGSEGAFVHPSSPIYPMNWYMKITDKGVVYDELSSPSQAKAFIINVIGEEDQTTGIRTLYPAEKQVREVYDVSGRRLDAPKKGQVNIINGKKILVK